MYIFIKIILYIFISVINVFVFSRALNPQDQQQLADFVRRQCADANSEGFNKLSNALTGLVELKRKADKQEVLILAVHANHVLDDQGNTTFRIPKQISGVRMDYVILKYVNENDLNAKLAVQMEKFDVLGVAWLMDNEGENLGENAFPQAFLANPDDKKNSLKYVVNLPAASARSAGRLVQLKYMFENKLVVVDQALARNAQGELSKFQLVVLMMKNLYNFVQQRYEQEEAEFVRFTEPDQSRNRGTKRRGRGGYGGGYHGAKRGNFRY